jgi:NADPH:quinone reductase-like Zn-dependent oxidoreductase
MLAAVVDVLGQPPRYQQFADPVANESEVLIKVRAAGLHPIVKALASGTHYLFKGEVPLIAGVDAVGTRPDGTRVFFGSPRRPWGTMAELCAGPAAMCVPLPDGIDEVQAAAVANPGMSAWLSLKERAALATGETVLILGATGVAGRLAIQMARLLGAKRIVAVGRDVDALAQLNVDATVALGQPEEQIREAFLAEATEGIDVVIDYLWGRPTELLLGALVQGFNQTKTRSTRLVEVGESAGKNIVLPGAALRSLDLKIMGSGFGSVPLGQIFAAIPTVFSMVAEGKIRIDVDPVPLKEVEQAWTRIDKGRRIVFTI